VVAELDRVDQVARRRPGPSPRAWRRQAQTHRGRAGPLCERCSVRRSPKPGRRLHGNSATCSRPAASG
jgi:hypothetical protein